MSKLTKKKSANTNYDNLKVYQVQGHRVQILHESNGPIEELQIPTLPRKMEQSNLAFDTSPRKAPPIYCLQHIWIAFQKASSHINNLLTIDFLKEQLGFLLDRKSVV